MAEASKRNNHDLMNTLVVFVLLTLTGAGVGFAVGTLLGEIEVTAGSEEASGGNTDKENAQHGATGDGKSDQDMPLDGAEEEQSLDGLKIIPFPAVLTTLAEPKGKWIRLEGSILMRPSGDKPPELLAEEAGAQILTYLRSVKLSQLESASGALGLRDDLDDTVRSLSGGAVRRILIHGLVVE